MSKKRSKRVPRAVVVVREKSGTSLPNELLLEVWEYLPAMERVSVSHVSSQWRHVALSTPRLWSRVVFVSMVHSDPRPCSSCRSPSRTHDIYYPRHGATNAALFKKLLLRSARFPLDVTIHLGFVSRESQMLCFDLLVPHRQRLARIHFDNAGSVYLSHLTRICGPLPSLRTLTAGLDDHEIEYFDLPLCRYEDTEFPVLNQVHLGAVDYSLGFFDGQSLPSVQELTLAPVFIDNVRRDLRACPNIRRLNLAMGRFLFHGDAFAIPWTIQWLADDVAKFQTVSLRDIPAALEGHILTAFDDARHRHLILDYQGFHLTAGSARDASVPSPCDALEDVIRLALRLRGSVYELDCSDALGRRREVRLDKSTVCVAPTPWDYYVGSKMVAAATVDAAAWDYFAAGLPDACDIPDLTLIIARAPAELDHVSLGRFAALRKLRVEGLYQGLRVDAAAMRRLATSRAHEENTLEVISIGATVQVDDIRALAHLARTVVHE